MTTIESGADLLDLLAEDGNEVPSSLFRNGGSKVSRHDLAIREQSQLGELRKVEEWMNQDGIVSTDPQGYLDVGVSLFDAILGYTDAELSVSVIQKMVKLLNIWIKSSKSCRLLHSCFRADFVPTLLGKLFSASRSTVSTSSREVCVKMITCLITAASCTSSESNDSLLEDETILRYFNDFILTWGKGKNPNKSETLNLFPVEILSQLTYATPSTKPITVIQMLEFLEKLCKKKVLPRIDYLGFLNACKSKDTEVAMLKMIGAVVRANGVCAGEVRSWIQSVSERDTSQPGSSTKPTLLAKQLLKGLTTTTTQ